MSDLFKVPPSIVLKLKTLTRSGAAYLLAPYRKDLNEDEYDTYLDMAQPDPEEQPEARVYVRDPQRRVFLAAAWIAGASHRQLGSLLGLQRGTIQDQIAVVLQQNRSSSARLSDPPLQWELLDVMYRLWQEDRSRWSTQPTIMAAQLLEAAREQL